ncbi:N-formylglutamate amidohydrolase [Salinimicrobium xinjiangense]|uniref:N-formylglutamate amidohydrolase n=1 Tax=Salinimicrobium xinjiangense TaxID=438596 RepID=UPI000415E350|nr:N-formylglutamate amidohydrolase [Salinimicrobium xinjiangense]
MNLLLTCEHAGNEIPEQYSEYFEGADEVLESHRGYDPGALDLFNRLSGLAIFCQPYMISRLLVEPNRSLNHPQLFSELTSPMEESEKEDILNDFYLPYRNFIEGKLENYISEGKEILHISVHTFTPVLNGEVRDADIGLLFDPSRDLEAKFCESFRNKFLEQDRNLKVRFNYPYLGIDDGFTTSLRKIFPEGYLGIELEVNQKFVSDNKMEKRLKNDIFEALSKAVNHL